ncbi:MAG: Branched-chain amino acid transport system permease protein LivM [Hydrogenibacillus schlegelii]|uniref:Branched-chain amino acid transport system permease protein LivM n=1 Tax=Hydrogenibacillus schlegelii TaxID=1484 RepID=A0A2T5GBU8_HYDSH|nr:branched-chain amino acid ABC transporter permease [Hydrogenibacillus schlegelii]PTQ53652.1 MAG: Branched-chain amino acid transport system permease protein LivM [Hydrogenibacillus schlegelii]
MKRSIGLFVLAAAALVFPLVVSHPYVRHVFIVMLIWATLGVAWNILGGYAGQVSLGHAAFFGVGAYTAGLLATKAGVSPWWGMLLGPIVATVIALPIGAIAFRLRGPYFALGTLALGEMFYIVFNNWTEVTNGARGILLMPAFTDKLPYAYLALFMLALALATSEALRRSKAGFYFVAVREDEDAAAALGIPTARVKMLALLVSAFLTGLAGAFYMNYVSFIDPATVFSLSNVSIMIILVVMLGGVATLFGPVVGAVVYIGLNELLRSSLGSANALVFGLLVIAVIVFLPNGLVGSVHFRRRPAAEREGVRHGAA